MKLGCFQSNGGLRAMAYADFVAQAAALGYEAFDVPPNNRCGHRDLRAQGVAIHATSAMVPPDLSRDEAQAGGDRHAGQVDHRRGGGRRHRRDHPPR